MEKVVQYKNVNYKVIKNGDDVVIQKEVNGSYTTLMGEELNEFLEFINGRVVSVEVPISSEKEDLRSQITDDILRGNIKTMDEIIDILNKSGLSDADKESLQNELEEVLLNNLVTDMTAEELEEYRQSILEKLKEHRANNEYLLSDFYMYNGALMHRLVAIDGTTGEQKEVSKKQFEMNELVIDKLISPSLVDFAENQEHLKNEYEIKTNIVGDTADYSFVGAKNSSMSVRDIPVSLAKRLHKEAEKTEVLTSTYEEVPEENEEQKNTNTNNENEVLEYDESGMPLQREEPLKLVRKKKETNYGYMNLPLVLVLVTIFGIGLYFLAKYILLK